MKYSAIIVAILVLLAGIITLLLIRSDDGLASEPFDPDLLESVSAKKQEALLEIWFTDQNRPLEKRVEYLKWLFRNKPETAETLVREHALAMGSLSELMSQACFELLKEREAKPAIALLTLGKELFPNDPHILGAAGIAAYLSGNGNQAFKLLTQAEAWRRDIPMVDFYLGGLLTESRTAAERARGKALLVRVVKSGHPEFSELAALMVLSNTDIPLIGEEFRDLYDFLEGNKAFRPDNPNLRMEIMRILMNRTIQFYPEAALRLADDFMRFPQSTDADRLVFVQLAQQLGQLEWADRYLAGLEQANFPEQSGEGRSLRRSIAVQKILTGSHEEGLEIFESLVKDDPEDAALPGIFQIVLNADPPMSVEEELLTLLLEVRNANVQLLLGALDRLMEIDPLREDRWRTYAAEKLLMEAPSLVGAWLIRNGGSGQLIGKLSGRKDLPGEACRMLAEAYLKEENPRGALETVERFHGAIGAANSAYLSARAHLLAGQEDMAYEKWREAYNLALGSDAFPMMKNLGLLAIQLDQPVTALRCLYAALNAGIRFDEAQAGTLLELTLRYGNLPQSIKVGEYLNETFPDDPVHKNNLAYFKFLAEQDLNEQVQWMRELSGEYPEVSNYQLTLALGLLKIGRQNEAYRLIQNTNIDWGEAGNRAQLIYAVILGANNQRVVAEGLLQNIDMEALIPEEKALLESM